MLLESWFRRLTKRMSMNVLLARYLNVFDLKKWTSPSLLLKSKWQSLKLRYLFWLWIDCILLFFFYFSKAKQSFGGVLRNFAKFTGKYLCQSLFFNEVEHFPGSAFVIMCNSSFLKRPIIVAQSHCLDLKRGHKPWWQGQYCCILFQFFDIILSPDVHNLLPVISYKVIYL